MSSNPISYNCDLILILLILEVLCYISPLKSLRWTVGVLWIRRRFLHSETQHEKVVQLFCEVADNLICPLCVCVCVCIMSGLTRPIILAASSTIWPQSCPLTKPWRAENTSSQPSGYRRHTCDIYSLWSSFTPIPHQTHTRTRIRTRMHAHTDTLVLL